MEDVKEFNWVGKNGKSATLAVSNVDSKSKKVTINNLAINGNTIVSNVLGSMMMRGKDSILVFSLNRKDTAIVLPKEVVDYIHPRKAERICINSGSSMQQDEGNKYIRYNH